MEPVGGGGASSAAERYRAEAARAFQHYRDRATPHTAGRWAGTLLAAAVYALRVYYMQGFYVVSYGLGIYLLNLLIGFLSPMVDPELEALDQAGPVLPTSGNDEFKPFIRRLPEFKFWYAITKAFCVAFVMTFFSVFAAVPVGGAAATFGGATAASPKGNLHQTLPHNSASKFYAPSPLFLNY